MQALRRWGHSGQWYTDPKEMMKKADQSSLPGLTGSSPIRCGYVSGVVNSSQELATADSSFRILQGPRMGIQPRHFGVLRMSRSPASVFRLSCVYLNFWAQPPS